MLEIVYKKREKVNNYVRVLFLEEEKMQRG